MVTAVVAVLAAVVVVTAPRRAECDGPLEGTWVYAGGRAQRQQFLQAIEVVVRQMNTLVRVIARSRMTERIVIAPRIVLAEEGERLRVQHQPLPPRLARFDGVPLSLTTQAGDQVAVRYDRGPGQLVEVISHGRSTRRNVYRVARGRPQMTLSSQIRSSRLPATVQFSLDYRRQ